VLIIGEPPRNKNKCGLGICCRSDYTEKSLKINIGTRALPIICFMNGVLDESGLPEESLSSGKETALGVNERSVWKNGI
jgi:hypothetical protein